MAATVRSLAKISSLSYVIKCPTFDHVLLYFAALLLNVGLVLAVRSSVTVGGSPLLIIYTLVAFLFATLLFNRSTGLKTLSPRLNRSVTILWSTALQLIYVTACLVLVLTFTTERFSPGDVLWIRSTSALREVAGYGVLLCLLASIEVHLYLADQLDVETRSTLRRRIGVLLDSVSAFRATKCTNPKFKQSTDEIGEIADEIQQEMAGLEDAVLDEKVLVRKFTLWTSKYQGLGAGSRRASFCEPAMDSNTYGERSSETGELYEELERQLKHITHDRPTDQRRHP